MYHYMYLSYRVPRETGRYDAMERIERYVYDHLDEFGCLPRDDTVTTYIGSWDEQGDPIVLNLMIRLTDAQAIKTASDRSEFKHPEPDKMDKKSKKRLRSMSKRKRSMSEDEPVHKKLKECRCPICLEDMDSKKNITLECNCVFHYTCIKKWLSCKKICPTCETAVKI